MARRVQSPVFVGRRGELASAVEAVRRVVATREGTTLLVTGEAGIGKSRFLHEVADFAADQGLVVLKGACDEFGSVARPFGILQQLAPGLLRAVETKVAAAPGGVGWETLESLVTGVEPAVESGQLSRLFVGLLAEVCEEEPVLVVVDDLHWADESSRMLFREMAGAARPAGCLLVAAYRHDEIERGHPLRSVLASVHREARPEVLHLKPFDGAETRALAAALGMELAASAIESYMTRSAGNVFLLEELFSAEEGALPPGASDVLLARLDRLPTPARIVAEAAALDSALARGGLRAVTQLPPEEFDAAFDSLVSSGLLLSSTERFGYRHALFREIAYQAIPESRRPLLHERVAEWMEAAPGYTAAEAARHWRLTERKDRALAATITAAREALHAGASPEAADLFDIAFSLYDAHAACHSAGSGSTAEGRTGTESEAPGVAATAFTAVTAYQMSRRFGRAIEVLDGILGGPTPVTAAERAGLLIRLAVMCWQNAGHEERDLPRVRQLFESAIDCLDSSVPTSTRVEMLATYVSTWTWWFGLNSRVLAALEEAEQCWAAEPSSRADVRLRVAQAVVAVCQGTHLTLEGRFPECNDLQWQRASLPDLLVGLLSAAGQHDEAIRLAAEEAPALQLRGLRDVVYLGLRANAARSLTAVGRWREALAQYDELVSEVGMETLEDWDVLIVGSWGPVLARSGRSAEAEGFFRTAARWIFPFSMDCFAGPGAVTGLELVRARESDLDWRAIVASALERATGHNLAQCGEAVAIAVGLEADAAFQTGSCGDGERLADGWISQVRSCLDAFPNLVTFRDHGMFLEQAEAERARLCGKDDAGRWEDLALRWHALPRPYEAAYCRYRAAFALLLGGAMTSRRESRSQAAEHLSAALATSRELGAVYLEADIVRLMRLAALQPKKSQRPGRVEAAPLDLSAELSAREIEVLHLLVAGNSNGQIGVRLGISTKTASVHVSNILRKLNASNRVEAAVRASQGGLF